MTISTITYPVTYTYHQATGLPLDDSATEWAYCRACGNYLRRNLHTGNDWLLSDESEAVAAGLNLDDIPNMLCECND